MKKLKAMLLVPMLAVTLIGCGNTATETVEDTEITNAVDTTESDENTDITDDVDTNVEAAETSGDAENTAEEGIEDYPNTEDTEAAPRELLEGGEITDTCLELRTTFIDFEKYTNPELKTEVEKRSETNLIVTYNVGESNEYDAQYSVSLEKVGETKYFDTIFPDGYEFVADTQYGDIFYSVTEESNGKRIVILQDTGDDYYLSIRAFEKTSADVFSIIEEIKVKDLPVYIKQ